MIMQTNRSIDRKLAEEFAKEVVTELRKENKLKLNLLNWGLLEATLVLKIQQMTLAAALDKTSLTEVIHETLNHILGVNKGEELDEQLFDLLDKDLINLVITPEGKLAYKWK